MEQYIPKSVVLAGIERLSKIIDSLQEEPVSENLEKAAKDYSNNLDNIYGSIGKQTRNAFKAGAEWQKKQDQETIELAEDHAMLAGMEKMKEQMMKDAINGIVEEPNPLQWRIVSEDLEGEFVVKNNLIDGTNVKLIIIKED